MRFSVTQGVIIMTAAFGLLVFGFTQHKPIRVPVPQPPTQTGVPAPGIEGVDEKEVITPTEDDEAIDTSDWQTYKNEELGYTFTFPENWSFSDLSNGFSITSPDYNTIGEGPFGIRTTNGAIVTVIHVTTSLSNISEYEFTGPSKELFDAYGLTETKVSGFDATEREWQYAGDASLDIEFIANGLWFTIHFNGETENEKDSKYFNVFQQMIDNMNVER